MAEKMYSVGIYARLSVEGDTRKNESIETQIEIAREYMRGQKDMALYGCYSDLGRTGTDFEREGFKRLMEDVRHRLVDCVIVKDFSRFGRNYIETGNYIQKIFPFLGVRFIAVTDCFDSLFDEGDDLGVNLKNLANEMYARDIAFKVKSSKRARRESGGYVGGLPPYGYRAEWGHGRRRLLAEQETAEIVRDIFRQYGQGRSLGEIAAALYAREIHRPTEYRRYHHPRRQPGEELREWPRSSLKTMLTNPVYTGGVPPLAENDWRPEGGGAEGGLPLKEKTHEAIISGEQFCRVAERFQGREGGCQGREGEVQGREGGFQGREGEVQGRGGEVQEREDEFREREEFPEKAEKTARAALEDRVDIFEGVLFCGCCGRRLGRRSPVRRSADGHKTGGYSYFCRSARRLDRLCCAAGSISQTALTEMVKEVLRHEAALNAVVPEVLTGEDMKYALRLKQELQKKCNAIQNRLKAVSLEGSEQYRKYREGIISREAFREWKAQSGKETEKAERSLELARRRICELEEKVGRSLELARRGMRELEEKAEHSLESERRRMRELETQAERRGRLPLPGEQAELSAWAEPDRGLIRALVQEIRLYPDRRVEILLRFRPAVLTGIQGEGSGIE